MAARGLQFQHAVVAGLAERKFPALPRPDPLLFDDERAALAAETGRPLAPTAARRPEEERFLLGAAFDTAARRLTLTASRRDAVLDRERVPSQFFDRAVEALGDAGSSGPHPALRRTDLGSTPLDGPPRTLSEARQRLLQTAGRVGLAEVVPAFAHALSRMQSRDRRAFGPFEGRIEDLALREALTRRVVERGLSASALQTFAVCPHRFFLGRLLGLRAWEDPSERGDVDDLTRGQLYHDAARRVAEAWRDRSFGELSGKNERPIVASASAGALAAYEEEAGFRISPPVLREIVLRRLEGQLHAWLAGERSDAPDLRPIGAEVRFGPEAPGGEEEDSELSTDQALDVAGLALRGRVDLLATDAARARLRVTDFKAPRTRNRAETIRKLRESGRRIFGGELAQLPVYAAACAGPLAKKGKLPGVASVEYQFIAPERTGGTCGSCRVAFSGAELAQSVEGLAAFTVGALEAISEGVLIPKTAGLISDDHCRFCDFDAVCGEGHVRPFQEKAAYDRDPAVVRFFELEDIP
jgi:ATP-dependent helicase/DNAse subunit B